MRDSGTTLIELIISLALISVVFLIAGPLIVQSARVFNSAGKNLVDPDSVLLEGWMRHDVHSAISTFQLPQPEGTTDLVLVMRDGGFVTYGEEESAIVRKTFSKQRDLKSRHLVLPQLISWSWSTVQGCIMVKVIIPSHIDPGRAGLYRDPKRLRQLKGKAVNFCFSLRARGGRRW